MSVDLEARVGTVIKGKWTLERMLGSGGMAAVYVGKHKIGQRVAIKILHPEIAREPELRARFEQEARAVNQFVHRGAVEIRDIDTTDDGCPFLVMELLQGETLGERAMRLGGIETSEVLRIADELLDVLAAVHAYGIIHRDIKPDNLFCLAGGGLKVLDFGVAHVRQAAQSIKTRTGTTLGTVAYMPPEQVKGMAIDARADVFAVGATMFRLIAKRRIHEAQSDAELVIKMGTMPAPPLASVAPDAPAAVCAIVDHALAFDREHRYPSATEMQADVRAVRNDAAPSVVAPPVAAPAVPPVIASPAVAPAPTRAEAAPRTAPARAPLEPWQVVASAFVALIAVVLVVFYLWPVEVAQPSTQPSASVVAAPEPTWSTEPEKKHDKVSPGHQPDPDVARANCFLSNDCQEVCDSPCEVSCKSKGGCTIGAVHDVSVRCKGPHACVVSCAGNCAVTCSRMPCIVHCTPGFRCDIEGCPRAVESCPGFASTCGASCPE